MELAPKTSPVIFYDGPPVLTSSNVLSYPEFVSNWMERLSFLTAFLSVLPRLPHNPSANSVASCVSRFPFILAHILGCFMSNPELDNLQVTTLGNDLGAPQIPPEGMVRYKILQ